MESSHPHTEMDPSKAQESYTLVDTQAYAAPDMKQPFSPVNMIVTEEGMSGPSKWDINENPKTYCWGRMKRWQFILFWCIFGFIILFCIALGVTYLAILPHFVPKIFWSLIFEGDWSHVKLQEFRLLNVTEKGVVTKLYMTSQGLTLPVSFASAEMKPALFTLKTMENDRVFMQIYISDSMRLTGWDSTLFDLRQVGLYFPDPENTKLMATSLSHWFTNQDASFDHLSSPPFRISIDAKVDVMVCGIPMSQVDFRTEQHLEFTKMYRWLGENAVEMASLLNAPVESVPEPLPSLNRRAIIMDSNETAIMAHITGSTQEPFHPEGTIPAGGFTFSEIGLRIDSAGVAAKAVGNFGNKAQPFALAIGDIFVKLQIDKMDIAKFQIHGLEFKHRDTAFHVAASLYPDFSEMDAPKITLAASRLTDGNAKSVLMGIGGIIIKGTQNETYAWLDTVLSGIDIHVPATSLVASNNGLGSSMLSALSLKNVDVELKSNNTIHIQPNLTLPALISADIQVAPFTATLSADQDPIDLMHISLSGLSMSGGDIQSLSPDVSVHLSPQDEAAILFGKLVEKAAFGQDAFVALGQVIFAQGPDAQMDRMNKLFSVLRVRIPLHKLIHGSSSDAAPAVPVDMTPKLDMTLNHGDVDISDAAISLKASYNLVSQLPVNVLVPFAGLRTGLDRIDAVTVQAMDLGLELGAHTYQSGLNVLFGRDPELPFKLAEVVNGFMNPENSIKTEFVIQGLQLGPSQNEVYNLFDHLNITLPGYVFKILPDLLRKDPQDTTPSQPLFAFHMEGLDKLNLAAIAPFVSNVDVSTLPSTLILGAQGGLFNPLPISLTLPFVGLSIELDGSPVVSLGLTGLKIPRSASPADMSLALSAAFSRASDVPFKVAALIRDVQHHTSSVSTSLTGLLLGSSSQGAIRALSSLRFNPALQGASSSSLLSLNSVFPGLVDKDIMSMLPVFTTVDVSTEAQGSLRLSLNGSMLNVLPITLNVPFVQVDLLLENSRVVTVSVSGVQLGRGNNTLQLSLLGQFAHDLQAQQQVASAIQSLVTGNPWTSALAVSGILAGPSLEAAIYAFQQVQVAIPMDQPSKIDFTQLVPWISDLTMDKLQPSFDAFDIAAIEEGLQVDTTVSFRYPIPLFFKLGYTRVQLAWGSTMFVDLSVGTLQVKRKGRQKMVVKINAALSRDPSLKSEIGAVLKAVLGGQATVVPLTLGGFWLGESSSDTIQLFAQTRVPLRIPVGKTNSNVLASLPSFLALPEMSSNELGDERSLALPQNDDGLSISTIEDGLEISYKGFFNNRLPFSLRADYLALEASLAQAGLLAQMEMAVSVGRGKTPVSLLVRLKLNENEALADPIKTLYERFVAKETFEGLRLGGLYFGVSKEKAFDLLSEAQVAVPIPFGLLGSFLGSGGPAVEKPPARDVLEELIKNSSGIDFAITEYGLDLGFKSRFVNPLPLAAKIDYASVHLNLKEAGRLARVEGQLVIGRGETDVSLRLKVTLGRERVLAETVRDIYKDFVHKIRYDGFYVDGITFGHSAKKTFSLMKKITFAVPFKFDEMSKQIESGSKEDSGSGGLASLLKRLDVKVTDYGLSVHIGIGLPEVGIPLNVRAGYVSAEVILSQIRLLTLAIENMYLGEEKASVLDLPLSVILKPEDPAIADKVAEFVNPLLEGGLPPAVPFNITDIRFGVSKTDTFDLLSLIVIDVQELLLGRKKPTNVEQPSAMPLIPLVRVIAQDDGISLDIDMELKPFGFPADIQVGYGSVDASIMEVKFATILVDNVFVSSNTSNTRLSLHAFVRLIPQDSELPLRLANILNPVLNGTSSLETLDLGLTNIEFGSSAQDTFTLLQKVKAKASLPLGDSQVKDAPLDDSQVVKDIALPLTEPAPPSSHILSRVKLTAVKTGFVVDIDINMKKLNINQFELNLGYLSLDCFIRDVLGEVVYKMAVVSYQSSQMIAPGVFRMSIILDATARDADSLAFIGKVLDRLLPLRVVELSPAPPFGLMGGHLMFGASQEKAFNVLSEIKMEKVIVSEVPSMRSAIEFDKGEDDALLEAASMASLDSADVPLVAEEDETDTVNSTSPIKVNLIKVDLGLNVVLIDVSLQLVDALPFIFEVDIPYIEAEFAFGLWRPNGRRLPPAGTAYVKNIRVTPEGSIKMLTEIGFLPGDGIKKKVHSLVGSFIAGGGEDYVLFRHIAIGSGRGETCDILSLVGKVIKLSEKSDALPDQRTSPLAKVFKGFLVNANIVRSGMEVEIQGNLTSSVNFEINVGQVRMGVLMAVPGVNGVPMYKERLMNIDIPNVRIVPNATLKLDIDVNVIDEKDPMLNEIFLATKSDYEVPDGFGVPQVVVGNAMIETPVGPFDMLSYFGLPLWMIRVAISPKKKNQTTTATLTATPTATAVLQRRAEQTTMTTKEQEEKKTWISIGNVSYEETNDPDYPNRATVELVNKTPLQIGMGEGTWMLMNGSNWDIAELRSTDYVQLNRGSTRVSVDFKIMLNRILVKLDEYLDSDADYKELVKREEELKEMDISVASDSDDSSSVGRRRALRLKRKGLVDNINSLYEMTVVKTWEYLKGLVSTYVKTRWVPGLGVGKFNLTDRRGEKIIWLQTLLNNGSIPILGSGVDTSNAQIHLENFITMKLNRIMKKALRKSNEIVEKVKRGIKYYISWQIESIFRRKDSSSTTTTTPTSTQTTPPSPVKSSDLSSQIPTIIEQESSDLLVEVQETEVPVTLENVNISPDSSVTKETVTKRRHKYRYH